MARLCIRVLPNAHPTNPSLTPLRTQPGNVVCVVADGHVFSWAEQLCGQYRFIDVPGVDPAMFNSLMDYVRGADGLTMIRRKNLTLDPVVLSGATWIGRTSATKAQVDAITITST